MRITRIYQEQKKAIQGIITPHDNLLMKQEWLESSMPEEASISISNSVKKIRDYAFGKCFSLANITITDTVEHITYHGPLQSDDNWGALCRNRPSGNQKQFR